MADVFEDRDELDPWRKRLWEVIETTPWLSWQLLTKRPENVPQMVPWGNGSWPANVWLGVSVENTAFTHRADRLRELPAAVKFISAEPLLGSLLTSKSRRPALDLQGIDWVIAGGESGPRARPMHLDWVRELRDACRGNDVRFFLKQLGGHPNKRGGRHAVLDRRRWRELPPGARSAPAAAA